MKTLLVLFSLVVLAGCHLGGMPTTWEREASGECRDVQVNLKATEPARCPNRDHFAPSETGRSADGNVVAYLCVCSR